MSEAVKNNIQVCVRTRPTSSFAHDCLNVDPEKKTIHVHMPKPTGQHINNQQEDWSFKFDQLLHNSSQEQVYDVVARDIVDSVLEGYNGTIMVYGQTGAGKTFTMSGGTHDYRYRGIIPRAIGHVFRAVSAKPDIAYTVRVSYLEIYNEQFYDLLADYYQNDAIINEQPPAALPELAVRDDETGQISVKGLKKVLCESEEQALNYLFEGETNRAIAQHAMNSNSTRSHCIFTVYLEMRSRVESSEKVMFSKLNLVDLAGSERVGKTGSSGVTLNEAKYINKSLSFLEQVVVALTHKNRDHIPFRQSKLTNVLRDSLGGNCKTRVVANIWAERKQLEETISTLKFATRMMRIQNQAQLNVQLDPLLLVKRYEREIKELKQELAMHDTLANRGVINYDPYTPEEQAELRQSLNQYLNHQIDEIQIVSMRQVKEVFRQFKNLYNELQASIMEGGHNPLSLTAARSARHETAHEDGQVAAEEEETLVGDVDDGGMSGFGVGRVNSMARPVSRPDSRDSPLKPKNIRRAQLQQAASIKPSPHSLTSTSSSSISSTASSTTKLPSIPGALPAAVPPLNHTMSSMSMSSSLSHSAAPSAVGSSSAIPGMSRMLSEDEAFEEYKSTDGFEQHEQYQQSKVELRKKKNDLREISITLNGIKRLIDDLKLRLDQKRRERQTQQSNNPGLEVIDEEEYGWLKDLKSKKQHYQQVQQQRESIQSETNYLQNAVEQNKLTLCSSFLLWYNDKYGPPAAPSEPVDPSSAYTQDGDVLDDGEQFDQMELQRIMDTNPDSVAFFNARKRMMAVLKQKKKLSTTTRKPFTKSRFV